MTVIRRKQQTCEYPGSNTASDVESLDIHSGATSDAESVGDMVNLRGSRGLTKSVKVSEECLCKKRYLGRRKLRHVVNNGVILQTLSECEEFNGAGCVQLMDSYKTPFERLMENETALKFWNDFNELSEEAQDRIINPNKELRISSICQKEDSTTRISSKVKRAMKIKKNVPFEMIEDVEKNVLEHFENTPLDLYTTSPKNSFERLMLHAIAQYHNLESIGINEAWPPCIQVFTSNDKWKPTDVLFCDTVRELRK